MPVCEHVSVSSAQQMCQDLKQNALSVLDPVGVASLAPWWRKPAVYAEGKPSTKLTPTKASHPGVYLQLTCPLPQGIVFPRSCPSMQVALAPKTAVARKRWLLAVLCRNREGPGMESAEVYGKATVPGLTYQPGPRSPTRRRGFPAPGEGGRAEGRGQEGRDRQEPLVTNAVGYL